MKLVAVILFVACIVAAVLFVTESGIAYFDGEPDIYSFERDFSESWILSQILSEPEYAVYDAVYGVVRKYGKESSSFDMDLYREMILLYMEEGLNEMDHKGDVWYFVQWNDTVITNSAYASAEEMMGGEQYSYLTRDRLGRVERVSTGHMCTMLIEVLEELDSESEMTIGCQIKEDALMRYRAAWEHQEAIVVDTAIRTIVLALGALALLTYLISVCGKAPDGSDRSLWYDRIWAEIRLLLLVGSGIGAAVLCFEILDAYRIGHFPPALLYPALGTVAALGSFMILICLLSLVRNLKTGKMGKTSVILFLLGWILRVFCKAVKWLLGHVKKAFSTLIGVLSRKTGVILVSMLLIYTVVIGILGIGIPHSPLWLVLGILIACFACFVVAYRAGDLDEIQKGVSEIRSGNVSYTVPKLRCEDMRQLAADINDLAKGLDEAVSARVKAERLRSELITNVSHDLKTPITSILNYAELLQKTEGLSEEARDYAVIIAKKGERLKKLTQDLFDISKVQSGNETVLKETLDASLLLHQTLGEYDSEIQSSGLTFCVETQADLCIEADGRKMARALGNLIQNILKYAMKHTRVFIEVREKEGRVETVFKNTSAYPLTFRADEITERFVRGDESRTAEGNGLGLAIAKSYTELCGGRLDVITDGDLFKVILSFERVNV